MDISQSVWNEADNSNSTPAPDGAPEGMFPSGLNDTIRADRGAIKRWYNQTIPLLTGGSATNYTLTYSVAPTALADGMIHRLQFNAANGLAPTLNINGLAAKPLHYHCAGAWRAIPTGLLDIDEIYEVSYNSSVGTYRLLGLKNRTGAIDGFAGTTAPAGSLLCYGQAVSRTDYVGLFTVIGTTYGTGDGSTTFNLPDLRGRVAAGKDDMGGSAANRLTLTIVGTTLGATGGQQTPTGPNDSQGVDAGAPTTNVASINHTHVGGSVQPTIILNYAIKT
jgi:hypothetical protein